MSRFYGGTPTYWRHEATQRDLSRYVKMLPVLEAEESLLQAARVALGTGSLKRQDARALQRAWERRTGRPTRKARGPADTAGLRALGLIVDEGNT